MRRIARQFFHDWVCHQNAPSVINPQNAIGRSIQRLSLAHGLHLQTLQGPTQGLVKGGMEQIQIGRHLVNMPKHIGCIFRDNTQHHDKQF